MSDPQTIKQNWEAVQKGLERQRRLHSRKKRGGKSEIIHLLASTQWEDITPPKFAFELFDTDTLWKSREDFVDVINTQYKSEENDVKYRLDKLEEKVSWLVEQQIDKQSDSLLDNIKKEFSSIPFVREIYAERIPSGFDLTIVHTEEDTRIALSTLMKTKFALQKKLRNIYLDLTVLYSSDFNKQEWKNRMQIFHRQ